MPYVHLIGAESGATNGPFERLVFRGPRLFVGEDRQIAVLDGDVWLPTDADGTPVPGADVVLALVVSERGIPDDATLVTLPPP